MAGLHSAGDLLLAHGKDAIWAHSQAVAGEIKELAARFSLDSAACQAAALCHDVGGILPPAHMLALAKERGWPLDPSEIRYPFLLHQRASAVVCEEQLGITDRRVLDAVGCHTTLRADAGALDMALYLADKLAWDQPGVPPYEADVRAALDQSLAHACLSHIGYVLSHGMILMPHQWLLEAQDWLQCILA